MSPSRFTAALALSSALLLPALPAHAVSASCTGGVINCANALDGLVPADFTAWVDGTAFWTGFSENVTVDLGDVTFVGGLTLSLDNNDTYLIESSLDGSLWTAMLTVSDTVGATVNWGMDTFSTLPGHAEYEASLNFQAAMARYLRVSAIGGDGSHAVGEIGWNASAVPELSTAALLLAGLPLLGRAARRRSRA